MKKILISSIITSGILLAGNVHTNMDDRIKGLSYSGDKTDYEASKDGLGIVPLQHHSGTVSINNELKVQKILVQLLKSTNEVSKLENIKQSLNNNEIGSISDKEFITKLEESFESNPTLVDTSGIDSCRHIKEQNLTSSSGIYTLKQGIDVYCDMETDGGGWTLIGLINSYEYGLNIQPGQNSSKLLNPTNDISAFMELSHMNSLGGHSIMTKKFNGSPIIAKSVTNEKIPDIWKYYFKAHNSSSIRGKIDNWLSTNIPNSTIWGGYNPHYGWYQGNSYMLFGTAVNSGKYRGMCSSPCWNSSGGAVFTR